jgi:hypothetical protein
LSQKYHAPAHILGGPDALRIELTTGTDLVETLHRFDERMMYVPRSTFTRIKLTWSAAAPIGNINS